MSIAHRLGAFGPGTVEDVIGHAGGFIAALADVTGTVLDLGSGGGTPGLVIAAARPDLQLCLLDRRAARIDLLDRLIARLGYGARVRTVCANARHVVDEPWMPVNAVVSRRFGPPHHTLATARRFVGAAGLVVISEPPAGDRWNLDIVSDLGLRPRLVSTAAGVGRVAVFECSP